MKKHSTNEQLSKEREEELTDRDETLLEVKGGLRLDGMNDVMIADLMKRMKWELIEGHLQYPHSYSHFSWQG